MTALLSTISFLTGLIQVHFHKARTSRSLGTSTVEYVLMAVVGVALAFVVLTGIKAFIETKMAELK
ncbi:hypothetical protein [Devriesea agamarum]|uniref:hypothetical protein n=1 Tax=Devriesea agamarum TaxID=472569 RepID=UPI00071E3DB5|nr:hypothetical protein [Devriesea agamarum]